MKRGKRKHILIKNNIPGDVYTAFGWIKTLKTLVRVAIPKKYTFPRSKLKFPIIVGAKVGPAGTTKSSEKCVIRIMTKKA
jgi:hypothetical protein